MENHVSTIDDLYSWLEHQREYTNPWLRRIEGLLESGVLPDIILPDGGSNGDSMFSSLSGVVSILEMTDRSWVEGSVFSWKSLMAVLNGKAATESYDTDARDVVTDAVKRALSNPTPQEAKQLCPISHGTYGIDCGSLDHCPDCKLLTECFSARI